MDGESRKVETGRARPAAFIVDAVGDVARHRADFRVKADLRHLTGRVGLLLAGVVLVALAVAWLLHRPAKHDEEPRQPVAAGRRHD